MTETTTFPFSALDDAPGGAEADGDRRSLALVLGGGLLAVAVLGGAVFLLTGEEELPFDETATSVVSAPQAEPVAAPADQPLAVPVANTESKARSPFEPKYVEPAPVAPAPVAPVVPSAGPAFIPPTIVVQDPQGVLVPVPTGNGGAAPAAPVQPAPAEPAPREYRLVLTGVSTAGDVPVAEFTIDGAVFNVKATEIFGTHGQLLLRSLQQGPKDGQWTATIQVGDARPIDLVTNEAVYVR